MKIREYAEDRVRRMLEVNPHDIETIRAERNLLTALIYDIIHSYKVTSRRLQENLDHARNKLPPNYGMEKNISCKCFYDGKVDGAI